MSCGGVEMCIPYTDSQYTHENTATHREAYILMNIIQPHTKVDRQRQGDQDNVRKSWGQITEGEEGKDRKGRLVSGNCKGKTWGREEREGKTRKGG